MLDITGDGSTQTCDGLTRRDFLQVGALSAIGLSLADVCAAEERAKAEGKSPDKRSAIMIFNLGAPSQLDTFDMKPDAPREIRGPFRPVSTKADGMQISELFPMHAKVADKFSLVRACYHTGSAVHDSGHQMMQTGRLFSGGIESPHVGCALSFLKGRRTDLPAHVILPQAMVSTGGNMPHGQEAGFLGKAHDPFVLNADPSKDGFKVPDLLPPSRIGEARLERRKELRGIVEDEVKKFETSESARLLDSNYQAAFRLMTSREAREAFDLSKESKKVRERYGMNPLFTVRQYLRRYWPARKSRSRLTMKPLTMRVIKTESGSPARSASVTTASSATSPPSP
ncbi:MAG: DUF1501 domain-containing protein, partial [Planctomycetota bacterium]